MTNTERAAAVARAEYIVETLSDRIVREGWHETFDRDRATRFLENVRTFDENDGNDPRFCEILQWTRDHGQSLDWIFCGDPVGMICNAARNAFPPSASERRRRFRVI